MRHETIYANYDDCRDGYYETETDTETETETETVLLPFYIIITKKYILYK